MLRELGVPYVILGHSERRQYYAENDADLARKVRAALDVGLRPVLCCGETLEEREAGRTEDKVGGQLDAGLAEVGVAELALVAIAYEPIWAIGTGVTATPAQAQETVSFVRRRVRERFADAADGVRILYGGSVKSGNIDVLDGAARHRRRARRRGEPRRTGVRAHRALRGAACLSGKDESARGRPACGRPATGPPGDRPSPTPRAPVVLVVLDGWGCAPPGSGQRRQPGAHAGLRPAARRLPARHARRVRPGRGAAAGPDGQLRGRAPQHRRRPGRLPGPHAHQRGDRRRRLLRKPRAQAGVREGRRARQHAAPHGSGLGRRRAQRHGAPRRPVWSCAAREKVASVVVHAFLDGRDTLPRSAKGYLAEIQQKMDDLGVGRFGVVSGRYYAMDRDTRWDRVKLAYDALVYGQGFFAADCAGGGGRSLQARRERRVRAPHGRGARARLARRRRRRLHLLQLPPGPRPRAHARLRGAGLRRVRPRPAPAGRRLRDDDASTRRSSGCRWPSRPSTPTHVLADVLADARAAPAARRRDREVRARDVLLQRRREKPVDGRDRASSCRAPATCRPTTTSPR